MLRWRGMWRRVPALLLVYVTLDFANPLMPGAVRFEEGSVEVVQADRAGRTGVAIMIATTTLASVGAAPDDGVRALRPSLPPTAPARARRVVRRSLPGHSGASPSPTEDH